MNLSIIKQNKELKKLKDTLNFMLKSGRVSSILRTYPNYKITQITLFNPKASGLQYNKNIMPLLGLPIQLNLTYLPNSAIKFKTNILQKLSKLTPKIL